ncbi:GTPase-activating protein Gyp8 [Malassezia pachydermatis]
MDQLRTHLRAMISTTLRTYPALHYFQGLHDIVAILLLTLCPGSKEEPVSNDDLVKLQNVVNYVCLHFVRDSMTRDLMPAMSHLKVVRNILRAADAPYAYALERVFYPNHVVVVLSWMLTLFTHDMPTLSSAQRILDFVWTHGPASTAYVCAALLLSRKDQVAQKASEQHRSVDELELPVLHQILSGAPEALGRDEMLMERVLQHAGTLMDTYSLRCPAVRAHLIVGQDSVLFTWPHVSTTENAVRILSLPTPQLALDPMPTPREEKLAQMPNTLKKPRTAEILWQVIQRRRAPYLWLYPRILTMSAMSLLFSGGLATFLLAIFLADRPRM